MISKMKNEGIIVKTIPYKETSKIVYLYTNEGFKSVKAIGAKKSKNSSFGFGEIGNIVSFIASDSSFPTISEYEIIYSSYKLTEDFNSIMALGKIIELLNYLPEDSIHYRIYPFIKDIIMNIDKNPLKALTIYLIKMTYNFGVSPKLDSCIICGNNNIIDFDVRLGGAICNNHSNNDNYLLKLMVEYYKEKKKIEEYNDYDFKKVLEYLNEYYLIHTNIDLKIRW